MHATAPPPRVKICCIASVQEAELAVRYGAAAVGLVSAMPSGPGPIPEQDIERIARTVAAPTETFLLTSLTDAESVIRQHRRCRTTAIQLCDRLATGSYGDLRRHLPGIALIQVIHVTGPESLDEAEACAPDVDALLLDSGNRERRELGGTGRVHDWRLSREIRNTAAAPVYLAGGLSAANVRQAVETVEPYGVDVCSGVRTSGALDEEKLAAFVRALRC